jgi:thioredoxin reductase
VPKNDFDLIVVGAGIVSMSTAIYVQKEGLKTLMCDLGLVRLTLRPFNSFKGAIRLIRTSLSLPPHVGTYAEQS